MKKMIISMLALLAIATTAEAQVQINETNFPDEQFRNYVKSKLDIDQDGVLSTIEISAAQNLVLPTTIANHKGIEYFTEMTNLNCSNSYLTKLDLSKNTKLSFLQCENNLSLSSLVFPKTNLGGLICKKNALTSLDVSGAAKLWTFTIEESQLTSLNVSGCTELKKLDCQNGKLASLNASGCTALKTLNCSNNKLTSLNVSGCTALTELDCRNNSLTSLNVSANTKLITLNCGSNSLTSLNVSGCTKLEDLSCRNNKLTSLNVSGFTELANLDCAKNQLASLNVSANTKLYFLFCYSNKIKGTAMQTLVESLGSNGSMFYAIDKKDANEQNTITEEQAGIAMAKGWHTYDWYGGNPKEIDAYIAINATNFPDPNFRNWLLAQSYGKDSKLYRTELDGVTTMDVSGKSIANLKGIEFFEKLTHLNCSNNQLTALDVSSFPQLRELKCYGNQIKIAANMDALIESRRQGSSLPSSAYLYAIDTKNSNEQNVLTTFQVSRAKNKGWIVMDNNGGDPVQYAGTDSGFSIDEKTFPDANFRNYVNSNIDTNKDGYLSDAEIAAVTSMNVSGKSIENLKGIGFFTALTDLHCHKNKLTSLDLSANTKLSYLECGTNQLTELNVSKNTNLQTIWCNNNKLTALDLSKNTKLTSLYCYGNQIKGDKMQVLVNNLPKVTSGKGKLHVIDTKNSDEQNDITKAQVAIAKGKNWKVYDWNGTSPVEYAGSDDPTPAGIAINETNFPDEKFRNWVLAQSYGKDGILTDAEIAAVTSISVVERSIKNLKGIGFFTALTDLHCHKNKLTSLDLSANTKLSYLDCGTNQLTELNVSKNTNLQTIWCNNNKLTALDLSKNTKLTSLYCFGNQIKGDKMQALVNSLPTVSSGKGKLHVIDTKNSDEQNDITKSQVAIAKGKNWTVYDRNGTSPVEYAGSDDAVSYKVGDVTGDDNVNNSDVTTLGRYVKEWDGWTEKIKNMNAADVNRDGEVKNNDVTFLGRAVKGWEGYEKYLITVSAAPKMMMLPSVNAAKAMTLEVGNVKAKTSDAEVKVPINATKNDGFGSGIITIEWDKDKLELTGVEYSSLAPNNQSAAVSNKGTYKIAFGDDYATKDFTGTGTFFTLTFKIPSGSVAGTIPVKIIATDIQDCDVEDLTVTVKNGGVTLETVTSIDNGQLIMDNLDGDWYSIDGQKLSCEPKKAGVYIHNGKKIVKK